MWRAAVAAGTASDAARTRPAAPRRTLRTARPPSRGAEHPPQAVLELDLRLPAEQLACPRDVGLAHLRIVDGQRLVHDLGLRAGHAEHRLRELVQRELVRVAEVDREV